MPLKNYGVLAGRVVASRAETGQDSPHFQIHVRAADTDYRVAVNVLSRQAPSELLYAADEHFAHPLLGLLPGLADGITELAPKPGGAALDLIRGNLVDRAEFRAVPHTAPGPDNDLADKLAHFVERAASDPAARIYAFGERWGPEPGVPDKIFGFLPGNGVHDIHMNQGNSAEFRPDDGVWQDGGLILHFSEQYQWVAIFLAFQSQAWHTDEQTGHALTTAPSTGPEVTTAAAEPDHRLRIIAALVNPIGPAPEAETVTLINPGADPVDLSGWTLLDRQERAMVLDPVMITPGDTLRIPIRPPVQLGNRGGLLTLLDAGGLKVDGVAYTEVDAGQEGRSVVFS